MRGSGFEGSDGVLYYFAATVSRMGPGVSLPNEVGTVLQSPEMKDKFANWFYAEVKKVAATMKANPSYNFVAVTNDGKGPDKLGFRIGPPMMEWLIAEGIAPSRVTLGDVLPESAYSKGKK